MNDTSVAKDAYALVGNARALIERVRKLSTPLRAALEGFEVALDPRPRLSDDPADPEVVAEERRHYETVLAIRRRQLAEQVAAVEKALQALPGA